MSGRVRYVSCESWDASLELFFVDTPKLTIEDFVAVSCAQSALQQSRSSWLDMKNIYCGYSRRASYTGRDAADLSVSSCGRLAENPFCEDCTFNALRAFAPEVARDEHRGCASAEHFGQTTTITRPRRVG